MNICASKGSAACLTLCCFFQVLGWTQEQTSSLSVRRDGNIPGRASSFQSNNSLSHAEVHNFPAGKEISHDHYIRVVSEASSPVERLYVPTKDGLYVAAALRRPKQERKLPALVYFHGAPGGKGMDVLVNWSLGATGSPVWERFLQEGYVIV